MASVSMFGGNPGTVGWLIVDVYAAATWSALAFQPVLDAEERRENLRREVLDAAAHWIHRSAENARVRIPVTDPSPLKITIDPNNVASVTNNLKEATAGTVEALKRNAALDREEIDFLWWALLGRSRLLKRQLSSIIEPTRIVAAGIEAAKLLRRLPCEVHREIVLRTLDQDPQLDLMELLEAVGDDREELIKGFDHREAIAHPTIFPLLNTLVTGEASTLGADIKRTVSEWGERALLEAGFAKMINQGLKNI